MQEKVLVVDDEPLILKAVERSLIKSGYEVFCAGDRASLGALMVHGPFDLLITDVHLTDANSDEIISVVAAASPGVRVLVMSGSISLGSAPAFIEKPFSIEGLRKKVRDILDEPQ